MQELYIDTPELLHSFCQRLEQAEWITLDTEFVREKTYYPKLCLLQICDGEVAACIDPLAIEDLTPLLDRLCNSHCDKVFHAASQDLEIFLHQWGQLPQPLFDTQLAAAMLGLGDQVGYAPLVEQLLGKRLGKEQTRTDWSRRPLDQQQIRYALDDVIYLGEIYQKLKTQLRESGRDAWLSDDFQQLANPQQYQPHPEQCWSKVKGKQHLRGVQLAILQSLAAWREQRAQQSDRPKRWILKDEVLIDLARRKPSSEAQLEKVRGLEAGTIQRHGSTLLELIQTAQQLPAEQWPRMKQKPPSLSKNQDALVDWLMSGLKLCAESNQITASSLASRKEVERLVAGERQLPLLQGWRHQVAGQTLLQLLNGESTLQLEDQQLVLAPALQRNHDE